MSCKADIRKAVYDKVMQEVVDGRYTFTRLDDNTIQINGKIDNSKTKAQSATQARTIAKQLVKKTFDSFSGQVTGSINQVSPYDPIIVTFRATNEYVDWLYNSLPSDQKTDGITQEEADEQERKYILSDSGPNTYEQLNLFSPSTSNPNIGQFAEYVKFKKTQVIQLERRLSEIERQKKIKDIDTAKLTKLKNLEREIKLVLDGSFELGKIGIKDEIADLEKNAVTKAVEPYALKDLARLEKLVQSNDLNDLNEAQRIVDFWTSAGTFSKADNPFFTQDEIFLPDQNGNLTTIYQLAEPIRDQYAKWGNTAKGHQLTIDEKKKQITVDIVNQDYGVQRTYGGKRFNFEELVYADKGLKDADWLSMWTMDITQGIASHNGILPQAMFSYLSNSFEKKLAWAREIEEKINRLNPLVQKELTSSKFNGKYTLRGLGILGLGGASYNIFKEVSKEGNETGGIVQRFVKEFYDAQSSANNSFRTSFKDAKLIVDKATQRAMFNKAFEEQKKWRRNNTIIIDITKIPEIATDTDFAEFNAVADNTYKNELVKLLGDKGYNEAIESQKNLLRKYQAEKQSILDTALHSEGKTNYADLSDPTKQDLKNWENNHSPLRGHEDYYNPTGLFIGTNKVNNFMDYNHFIPRKYKVNIAVDTATNSFKFTDTNIETGNYDKNFEVIESNPILSEFYDVVKEVTETIRENMPPELQHKVAFNTLPGLMKTSAEIIADKNIGWLSATWLSFKHMMERIKMNFGVHKQAEISFAQPIDPATGKPPYQVNDGFLRGNAKAVADRMAIEKTKFLQSYNRGKAAGSTMDKIKRFSIVKLSGLSQESLNLLAEYTHTEPTVAAIKAVTGDNVEIGKYIRNYSLHTVVQSQSFDLGKLTKYFANATMMYAARQEALPALEIMRKHYDAIKNPHTNNVNNQIQNIPEDKWMKIGVRTHANKQMDDWFERVVLDNYGLKHVPMSDKLTSLYTKEEKEKIKEIDELITKGVSKEEEIRLNKIKDSLGKVKTWTATIDNLLSWIRTLRLGYNISSMSTNFLEGLSSNLIIGASDQYFDPNELFYGYHVVKFSFWKNISFGKLEHSLAKKNRSLMDKFNVIMDSKNELQKSSTKTVSSKLEWLNPHAGNQRVEYINQSPLMIAMLRTSKIKGLDGSESSVWDAYNPDGHLKDNFKTPENIKNWEEMSGEDYLVFKQKLNKVIVLAHGNYDELRGMMAKSNSTGKAFMMFKTWLPNAIYQRFATEQDDIQAGTQGFKGKYRSYTATTAGIHAGIVGTALFGPIGIPLGILTGIGMGVFKVGRQTDVGVLRQSAEVGIMLGKKMLGVPVNLIAGRKVIGVGTKGFNSFVGKGEFTQMDADNLKSNMTDISLQLAWLAMILITKAMFWDDEDKTDDPERMAHNILVNKLMQLSTQGAMYVNPLDKNNVITSTTSNVAILKYLLDVGKLATALSKVASGESDTIPTGVNAGESRIGNAAGKLFLPGMFKDVFGEKPYMGGFEDQADKVFTESPWHKQFRSEEALDKSKNQSDRASRKAELEKEYKTVDFDGETEEEQLKEKKKYIMKQLNEEYPTPTRLKKLGYTREEYELEREQAD